MFKKGKMQIMKCNCIQKYNDYYYDYDYDYKRKINMSLSTLIAQADSYLASWFLEFLWYWIWKGLVLGVLFYWRVSGMIV